MTDPVLAVTGLCAAYGRARILFDLAFTVASGEVAVLLGRNGAGKSTTLKSIMGLVGISAGSVRFQGGELRGLPPYRIARAGIGYVPEERRIFAELTVLENLEVGRQPPRAGSPAWTVEALFALFPNLAEARDRPAGRMSGGEQQMLTIARTLMGNPRLLLLDEPSEGLAPVIVEQVAAAVQRLKREGVAVLLSEQNVRFAAAVADRAHVIEKGQIRFTGPMTALERNPALHAAYLGL
jgi:branched-chain amino acid transport system ATP-binding protein